MIYKVNSLAFSYTPSSRKILNDVSFSVNEREIVCILGKNGSGKSTLLNCMLGLLKPENGEIYLCDKKLSSLNERQIAKIVGYVPQSHSPTFDYTVMEYVLMGCAANIGLFSSPGTEEIKRAEKALEMLDIGYLKQSRCTEISGGEYQQASIARAIAAEPKVILFDEPTAHLDYGNQLKVLRIIKNLADSGYAVIVTTHNPDHALLLNDRVAVLNNDGNVEFGSAEKMITEKRLSKIYGENVAVSYISSLSRTVCICPKL